jgi:hypothetical protein
VTKTEKMSASEVEALTMALLKRSLSKKAQNKLTPQEQQFLNDREAALGREAWKETVARAKAIREEQKRGLDRSARAEAEAHEREMATELERLAARRQWDRRVAQPLRAKAEDFRMQLELERAASARLRAQVARLAEELALCQARAEAAEGMLALSSPLPLRSGWLSKRGHVVPSWKTRWFVLQRGKLLYYVNQGSKGHLGEDLKGSIDLSGAHVQISRDASVTAGASSPGPRIKFFPLKLQTAEGREYQLRSASEADRAEWIAALQGAIRECSLGTAAKSSGGAGLMGPATSAKPAASLSSRRPGAVRRLSDPCILQGASWWPDHPGPAATAPLTRDAGSSPMEKAKSSSSAKKGPASAATTTAGTLSKRTRALSGGVAGAPSSSAAERKVPVAKSRTVVYTNIEDATTVKAVLAETWLAGLGLERYATIFAASIDMGELEKMDELDLIRLGITSAADRRTILDAARKVAAKAPEVATEGDPAETAEPQQQQQQQQPQQPHPHPQSSSQAQPVSMRPRLEGESVRDAVCRLSMALSMQDIVAASASFGGEAAAAPAAVAEAPVPEPPADQPFQLVCCVPDFPEDGGLRFVVLGRKRKDLTFGQARMHLCENTWRAISEIAGPTVARTIKMTMSPFNLCPTHMSNDDFIDGQVEVSTVISFGTGDQGSIKVRARTLLKKLILLRDGPMKDPKFTFTIEYGVKKFTGFKRIGPLMTIETSPSLLLQGQDVIKV